MRTATRNAIERHALRDYPREACGLILAVEGREVYYPCRNVAANGNDFRIAPRSEEHTSELQSRGHLVCRLLLEKKKPKKTQASAASRSMTKSACFTHRVTGWCLGEGRRD